MEGRHEWRVEGREVGPGGANGKPRLAESNCCPRGGAAAAAPAQQGQEQAQEQAGEQEEQEGQEGSFEAGDE